MDIICPVCSEPWDNYSLHDEAHASNRTYSAVALDFGARGCKALETEFGRQSCTPDHSLRSDAASAIYDLLGDDMDGAASLLDDFEYLGMLD